MFPSQVHIGSNLPINKVEGIVVDCKLSIDQFTDLAHLYPTRPLCNVFESVQALCLCLVQKLSRLKQHYDCLIYVSHMIMMFLWVIRRYRQHIIMTQIM